MQTASLQMVGAQTPWWGCG